MCLNRAESGPAQRVLDLSGVVAPLNHVMVSSLPAFGLPERGDLRMAEAGHGIIGPPDEQRGLRCDDRRALAPLGQKRRWRVDVEQEEPAGTEGETHGPNQPLDGRDTGEVIDAIERAHHRVEPDRAEEAGVAADARDSADEGLGGPPDWPRSVEAGDAGGAARPRPGRMAGA